MTDDGHALGIVVPADIPLHHRAAIVAARPLLTWMFALDRYRRLFDRTRSLDEGTFVARALKALDVTVVTPDGDLPRLPATGPCIVAANHPHGLLDGLALAHALHRRRSDVRILTNHLLSGIRDLEDLCFFVDPFGGRQAVQRSRRGLRAARRWLDDGHTLIMFPAGEVAHDHGDRATGHSLITCADSPWQDTVGRLALHSGAPIVPTFIAGRNRARFYRAGRLHARLRTLLLPREFLAKEHARVTVRFGRSLHVARHTRGDRASSTVTRLARHAVDTLAAARTIGPPPVVDPQDPAALEREVRALTNEHLLLSSGAFDVFCAPASALSLILRDIGRLRELTFRAVGEGTGQAIDLDGFDEHYQHLFVWHRTAREIVGAYRLGLTDRILSEHGVSGLYTSTLFRYDERLTSRLGPAIELGRSFVRAEYQRSSNGLLLLWKGIARFVSRSERYRVLFGPVSVSNRYADTSQQMLREFLVQNAYDRELAELVRAITPPRDAPPARGTAVPADIGRLQDAIAAAEPDGKGVPILLRQYLRLNAKVLGFNVDPAFGDALDALMVVDLREVDEAILVRYFGRENVARLFGAGRGGQAPTLAA